MSETFQQGSPTERFFNKLMTFLAGQGLAPGYCYQLSVRGRKSGRIYTTAVNLMEHAGKRWLVAPRGRTQWTRNAEAAGEIGLKHGSRQLQYAIRVVPIEERPELLKLYLETWSGQVSRFFKVRPGAPVSDFAAIADDHPVYELLPKDKPN